MRHNSLVMLAVVALAACDRDKPSTTTTTGAEVERPTTVEEVRMVMLAERPDATAAINALQITNVDGIVTLRGQVADEQVRKQLVERVKKMPGVKGVKDELAVVPARLKIEPPPGQPGQQDQQGQPRPQGQPKGGSH